MISTFAGERAVVEPLGMEKVVVDRKIFYLDLMENQRGRFLKITEDVGGRRDTIILPASGFWAFATAFAHLVAIERTLPAEPPQDESRRHTHQLSAAGATE